MITVLLLIGLFIFVALTSYFYWRCFFFFRDPERNIPEGENILSPADGTVVYVKKTQNKKIPLSVKNNKDILLSEFSKDLNYQKYKDWYVIGVFMHPTSVHVNRAPLGGKVSFIKYKKANNFPMTLMWFKVLLKIKPYERGSRHILENERNTICIFNSFPIYIIQIADIYVNKIVTFIKENSMVEKGQRIGMIKFGSQVDLLFPVMEGINVVINEGDKVKAGESIIALLNKNK